MKYLLAKQGVYRTIQGEGALQGEPMVFVRFGGCSVGCNKCDTDYKTVEKIPQNELVQRIENLAQGTQWIWFTGGEPMDQDVISLAKVLQSLGRNVAIATSGIKYIPHNVFGWVSVSPHSVTFEQRSGHELKIIPGLNGLRLEDIPRMELGMFAWKYVQPCGDNVRECIDFVLKNPGWRLGTQAHKSWQIP